MVSVQNLQFCACIAPHTSSAPKDCGMQRKRGCACRRADPVQPQQASPQPTIWRATTPRCLASASAVRFLCSCSLGKKKKV